MLTIRAGRAFRRENTSWVDPQDVKGLLAIALGDDGLLHLTWKNRQTGSVEDDLIIIPGDASFHKVTESTSGRIFVLKFESSDQKHFYWIQDTTPSVLEELEGNVNGLLQDPEYQPHWSVAPSSAAAGVQEPSVPRPNPPNEPPSQTVTGTSQNPANQDALSQSIADQLRALIENRMGARNAGLQMGQPSVSLTDILTTSSLSPLFEPSNAHILAPLQDHLPSDLPRDLNMSHEETIKRLIQSAPFRSCVRQLDRSLATGLLGRLMGNFGLDEQAGLSVETFLREIHDKAKREQNERDQRER